MSERFKLCWQAGVMSMALALSCARSEEQAGRRAEIKAVGPADVQVVPVAGQLPFCLAFTISERSVVRQLTMTGEGMSVPCAGGKPIEGLTYRIPPEEGKVRLYVVFSDQQVKASPIATQIRELAMEGQRLTAMDLRAPGAVQLEALEFTPGAP